MRHRLAAWIDVQFLGSDSDGKPTFRVTDTRTGEGVLCTQPNCDFFIADHSSSDGFYPVGDLVHRLLAFMGAKRCPPCARRQIRLNRLFKKI